MLSNLCIVGIVLFIGLMYYKLSLSKSDILKKSAVFVKIFLLILSFILAFIKQDFIIIGGFAFGGKSSVMMLVLIELADTFIDEKKI